MGLRPPREFLTTTKSLPSILPETPYHTVFPLTRFTWWLLTIHHADKFFTRRVRSERFAIPQAPCLIPNYVNAAMSIKLTLGDDRCCSDKPSLRLPYYIRRYASRLFLLAGFHFFALHLIYRTHCSKDRDGSRVCQVPVDNIQIGVYCSGTNVVIHKDVS